MAALSCWEQMLPQLRGSKQVKNVVRAQTLDASKLTTWDFSHSGHSDDAMYKDPNVFQMMRRGLAYIYVGKTLVHVVCGLPKFYDEGEKPAYTIPTDGQIQKKVYLEKV